MNTKKYVALCLMVIVLGVFTKCAEEFESPATLSGNTLVDVAATDTTLNILTAALTKTGIGISLDNINSGQHTVFSPTDSAFRVYFQTALTKPTSYSDDSVINYINNKMSSTSTITTAAFTLRLQYHVISSETLSSEITNSQVFTTINGARLSLSKSGSNVYINANTGTVGGKVRKVDIDGANGVIHTINKFLVPLGTGGGSGSPASVMGNTLAISIDYTKAPPLVTVGATQGNSYDLLANAIKKTGLATVLRPNVSTSNLPDYTFFAPDDAAMVTYLTILSEGTVTNEATALTYINGLATDDPKLLTLTNVVKYHVAAGRHLTTDLTLNENVTTLLTDKAFEVTELTPDVKFEDALAGVAKITGANTMTNAGVLHKIDFVLKPQ